MKKMSKSLILEKESDYRIIQEKKILSKIKSKFIVNMKCAFQDFSDLYLVLELMKGGSLRYHLNHYEGHFPERMIKFIIINIAFCLALIQHHDIVHRDIKPENFIFDDYGYLHLTDFTTAVYKDEEEKKLELNVNYEPNSYNDFINRVKNIEKELVGAIDYIAPEYILATENDINFSSDFYSFGVICYELIFLKKAFIAKSRYHLGKKMLKEEINYKCDYKYSESLINLVKQLLVINPKERLGTIMGFNAIKTCEYLYDFNWEKFFDQKYESPFVEVIEQSKKKSNIAHYEDMELFDFPSNNNYILDEERKMKLNLIESDPIFLCFFQDYKYMYFDKSDFNNCTDDIEDSFQVKNNKRKKRNKENDKTKDKENTKNKTKDNTNDKENIKNKTKERVKKKDKDKLREKYKNKRNISGYYSDSTSSYTCSISSCSCSCSLSSFSTSTCQ